MAFVSDLESQHGAEGTIYSWELVGRFRKELCDFPWLKNSDCNDPSYLKPMASLKDHLFARYRDGQKKVIGIAWRSERDGGELSDKTCSVRDVPGWAGFFETLKDKAQFVSLQYGDTNDEIAFARWKYGVEIYQDQGVNIFDDLDSAASQIASMDYVVSISTTAAHLAGALGVSGYVLLQKHPFRHWKAGSTLCPWYPTLWPIKQEKAGHWDDVLRFVASELGERLRD